MNPTQSPPTRREFLKKAGQVAGVAAPYVITSAALGAPGKLSASNRITTALIGSGGRGRQIIAGGDQVVAVCDVDAKHCAAAKNQIDALSGNKDCKQYTDFREVLARDNIDAVVVATPDHWHVPIAIAAIKANKAVYVEKPLTRCIGEGPKIIDVARRYGAIVQVGSQQRSDEKFIRACELVRNGRIGKLKTVKVLIVARPGLTPKTTSWRPRPVPPELDYEMWLGPAPWAPYHPHRCHYRFRFISDYSGGDITNWGAHHLDIAQWGLGADETGPVQIEGTGKRNTSGLHDPFYDLDVTFTYAGGEKVKLSSGTGKEVKTGKVQFIGTEGQITVSRELLDAEPKSLLTSRIGPNEIHLTPQGFAGTHMGHWLDCIRKRKRKGINATVQIGHRSATICHLANIAMELKRKLKWDPAAEKFIDDDEANRMIWRPMRQPWRI